jgi:hypothetical protein
VGIIAAHQDASMSGQMLKPPPDLITTRSESKGRWLVVQGILGAVLFGSLFIDSYFSSGDENRFALVPLVIFLVGIRLGRSGALAGDSLVIRCILLTRKVAWADIEDIAAARFASWSVGAVKLKDGKSIRVWGIVGPRAERGAGAPNEMVIRKVAELRRAWVEHSAPRGESQ